MDPELHQEGGLADAGGTEHEADAAAVEESVHDEFGRVVLCRRGPEVIEKPHRRHALDLDRLLVDGLDEGRGQEVGQQDVERGVLRHRQPWV